MSKISELSDGGSLQSTDYLIAVRSGGNVKVQADGNLSLGALTLTGLTVDTNTLHVDATNNRVGVGTTSPTHKLEIRNDVLASTDLDPTAIKLYNNSDGGSAIEFSNGVSGKSKISFGVEGTGSGTDDTYIGFSTSANAGALSEAMRIDSAGRLGLGTTSPSQTLHVVGNSLVSLTNSYHCYTTDYGIGTPDSSGLQVFAAGGDTLRFGHRASGTFTEAARLDASGNLLVGKAVLTLNTEGHAITPTYARFTRDGGAPVQFNRTTSDGDIALFYKDGTGIGSIGVDSGDLVIDGDNVVLSENGTKKLSVGAISLFPITDNSFDLGTSGNRYDDIFATNALIQTSDANEKQDIAELNEAERRVAVAAKGLLRKFRWKSSVAEKSDKARIHFGIIAQDLQAAFEAEGLDAGRYAMFIHSTWTDEETGEERSRMGVRYSELLAFIIAAL